METAERPDPTLTGPELFARYAQPPNLLGYCGPEDQAAVAALAGGLTLPREEVRRIAAAFEGAWPYLRLIAQQAGADPLAPTVVERYWIGADSFDWLDVHGWGHSLSDRFRRQAGPRWGSIVDAINDGGVPSHAFHVFCVYPWVGMLRQGFVTPSVEVLDRCRISWGAVLECDGQSLVVERRPLVWRHDYLMSGEKVVERFRQAPGLRARPGDVVSLHWGDACQRLGPSSGARLRRVHDRHLRLANRSLRLARLEPVGPVPPPPLSPVRPRGSVESS
jgi:Family of unknown function (DUF6390)